MAERKDLCAAKKTKKIIKDMAYLFGYAIKIPTLPCWSIFFDSMIMNKAYTPKNTKVRIIWFAFEKYFMKGFI